MLPIAIKVIKNFNSKELLYIFLSGTLGNLMSAYHFSIAEQHIDSALATIFNSLTPIFVIITGAPFYQIKTPANKAIGIIIAFAGSVLLFLSKGNLTPDQNIAYGSFRGISNHLLWLQCKHGFKKIAAYFFFTHCSCRTFFNSILALLVLLITGYFNLPLLQHPYMVGTLASCCMGVLGTAIANIWFYNLVKSAGGVFASMVTYGVPFVAIAWGIYYQETIGWEQAVCLFIILSGIYYANKKRS